MRAFDLYVRRAPTSAAAIAAAMAIVTMWPAGDHADAAVLTKKRTEAAAPAPKPATKDSRLELSVNLPFSKITSIANQLSFQIENSGTFSPDPLSLFKYKYEATIMLDKITIAGSGDSEHPIAAGANFRFAGHVKNLNVQGNGSATVPVAVKIGPDWCPVVEIGRPIVRWDKINVPNAIKSVLNSGLVDNILAKEAGKLADCATIKRSIASLWQAAVFPVASTTASGSKKPQEPAFYVNIRPRGISITDVKAENDRLSARVVLTLSVNVDRQAGKKETIPLPDPTTIPGGANDGDWDVKATLFGDLAVSAP
jgi:hypothetical protein